MAKNKEIDKTEIITDEMKDSSDGDIEAEEKQRSKLRKLKRKGKKTKKSEIEKFNDSDHEVEGSSLQNGIYQPQIIHQTYFLFVSVCVHVCKCLTLLRYFSLLTSEFWQVHQIVEQEDYFQSIEHGD